MLVNVVRASPLNNRVVKCIPYQRWTTRKKNRNSSIIEKEEEIQLLICNRMDEW